nr:MAG TPA: hypothetical protein [Bacteriophage sp.]DAU21656.1 MAG TPA: hypothetical protein [Caudoviricetes sp.]
MNKSKAAVTLCSMVELFGFFSLRKCTPSNRFAFAAKSAII